MSPSTMNGPADPKGGKRALRQQCRQRAAELAPMTPAWSQALCDRLLDAGIYRESRTLMAFLPLPAPAGEPDLSNLLQAGLAAGKRICLPRVDWASGAMEAAAVGSLDDLVATRHGLREPPAPPLSVPVSIEELDLILVPGLAFDMDGNRLGRGAGYFDRFLAARLPGAIACGICFEAQLVDRIPTDPWDVPVNVVATERRLITLRP